MSLISPKTLPRDLTAGLVVYLVALPLCLGIALASNAPMASGLLAGIVGGLVVGSISGSSTSVAGPAAGLTAVVSGLIAALGSFEAFLVAVFLGGLLQTGLGLARAGLIGRFFPSSVIKGLLAAIGVILILKQIPHVVGHDADVEGDMSFIQPDDRNTFTELLATFGDFHLGAAIIGLSSLAMLIFWGRSKFLSQSRVPAPLAVVIFGVVANALLQGDLKVGPDHLVAVPIAVGGAFESAKGLMVFPDWSHLSNPQVYIGAVTIALVASLETLLNLDAVDQLDPERRHSPPNRELIAQGIGNTVAGLFGALPVTSVIVRSSVNVHTGVKTKASTIFHGLLLVGSVLFVPDLINLIPLSALAAILLVTGFKLAKPALFKQMASRGREQFLPFIVTVSTIVLTDLLIGVLVGLAVATFFILQSNFRRPLRKVVEKHASGEVLRIELSNQVSYFSRAALEKTLDEVERGGHVLIDARTTDYIDPDVLDQLIDYRDVEAPAHGITLSLVGFKESYGDLEDNIQYVDYASREVVSGLTPDRILDILREGNQRFRMGQQLTRDLVRQMDKTAPGQAPMAVVLSGIDSRVPVELLFDLGIGDIFSVRIAGNVATQKVLGSMEYACAVAHCRLIVVMGHTGCGTVTSSVDLFAAKETALQATGCENFNALVDEIQASIEPGAVVPEDPWERADFVDSVTERNVRRTMDKVPHDSAVLAKLIDDGTVKLVGAMYDVRTGRVSFFDDADTVEESAPAS